MVAGNTTGSDTVTAAATRVAAGAKDALDVRARWTRRASACRSVFTKASAGSGWGHRVSLDLPQSCYHRRYSAAMRARGGEDGYAERYVIEGCAGARRGSL